MQNFFLRPDEAAQLVEDGAVAVFAGAEAALASLPRGRWIGGTTAYFMTEQGGLVDCERLFCTVISQASEAQSVVLPEAAVSGLTLGRFAPGFTYLLMPAFGAVHRRYAIEGPGLPGLFDQPVMGWVSGTHLDELGRRKPLVFDGWSGAALDDEAVALHVRLPEGVAAEMDIINLFVPGDGPAISFPETAFSAGSCTIDGRADNFATWLARSGADTRLPLVADYAGIMVNVAIRDVDPERGVARFYAPVVTGETYRLARPVSDYIDTFAERAGSVEPGLRQHTCNCILNYVYAGLDGRSTPGHVGPITFGEIAYMLLNQTLVRLRIGGTSALACALRAHAA